MNMPLDYLKIISAKEATIETRTKGTIKGIITAFDLSINLSLKEGTFIHGRDVIVIYNEQ